MATQSALQHVAADTAVLSQVFGSHSSIQSFINWRPEWSPQKEKWLKRPVQLIDNPFQHLTLPDAISRSTSIGLVCSDAHDLIAIDIDGVDVKTPVIAKLLREHPTYVEQSPSGKPNHLRLLYEVDDKTLLRKKGTFRPANQPNDAQAALELYSASSNFVTLTGQHALGSPLEISKISADTIIELFPSFKPTTVIDIKTKQPQQPTNAQLVPSSVWLAEVPSDRNNPQLVAFLGKHSLIYHDYWLLGLMAIQAAFGSIQGFGIADSWSQASGEYDLDELLARWESINDPNYEPPIEGLPLQHTQITAATYQWMFNEFSIQWPVLKGRSKIPKPDELVNFIAFLEYKGIEPVIDELTGVIFLDGPDYALYPTYYESREDAYATKVSNLHTLASRIVHEAMPYKFRPSTSQVIGWLTDLVVAKKHKINRFAREILRRPDYDPENEPDYIKLMGTEIIQRNPNEAAPSQEFHELLIRKWLLSLGRNMWPELGYTATSEGVLILSSPKAGIGKSSFGVRLFPKEWQHLHITTKPRLSGQFADKDSVQQTIGKVVVDFDEAERVFNKNDTADLKSYLTQQYDVYRPPYGRQQEHHTRFFSCMASTNETNLVFPKDGVRRYWWLNVDYVDTYAMDAMDMYNLWRQIYYELRRYNGKRAPYILTMSEIGYLREYLSDYTATTNAEEILLDTFDFSDEGFSMYTSGRVAGLKDLSYSISEVNDAILGRGNSIGIKALANSVTGLLRKYAPDFYISGRLVKNGMYTLQRQKRYFMPALRNDALKRAQAEDLD